MENYTVLALGGASGTKCAGGKAEGHGLPGRTCTSAPWDTFVTHSGSSQLSLPLFVLLKKKDFFPCKHLLHFVKQSQPPETCSNC